MQCDDMFDKIQRLNEQERAIREGQEALEAIRDGADAREAAAARALGENVKPDGREGQPENFKEIKRAYGNDALPVAADLIGLTESWEKLDPVSFEKYKQVDDKTRFNERIARAMADLGEDIRNNTFLESVRKDAAAFNYIDQHQTNVQVKADIARVNQANIVGELADIAEQTGKPPSKADMARFVKAHIEAVYTHAVRAFAKAQSGRLLKNYQRFPDLSNEQLILAFDEIAEEARTAEAVIAEELTTKPGPDGAPVKKVINDYIVDGAVTREVFRKALEGKAGAPQLREIQKSLLLDMDPDSSPGGKGYERAMNAIAMAAYKDSILFNSKSNLRNNYLSQKLIYMSEGLRQMARNPWQNLQGTGIRQKNLFDPTESGPVRRIFKAQIDGHRDIFTAHKIANDIIDFEIKDMNFFERRKASWRNALQQGFVDGHTPFAGNVDMFNTATGKIPPAEQMKVAQDYLKTPTTGGPYQRLLTMRNKFQLGVRILSNKHALNPMAKKLGYEKKIPLLSSLQLMTAVDQRQGMRIFLSYVANERLMANRKANPHLSYKQIAEMTNREMQEVLIGSTPTDSQVIRYRQKYGLGPEITNDMIASKLQAQNVGFPIIDSPEQVRAMDASRYQRMQNKPEGLAGKLDTSVQNLRQDQRVDAVVSFWRSPYNSQLFDWKMAFQPVETAYRVLQIGGEVVQGKAPSVEKLAQAQSAFYVSTMLLGSFLTAKLSGAIVGGGPIDPVKRKNWMANLEAQGKKANSIFGVEMGGVPLFNTLFLYSDLYDLVMAQRLPDADLWSAGEGIVNLLSAQIMRAPGFKTLQVALDMLTDSDGGRKASAALKTLAFIGNGWFNPVSGPMRDVEGLSDLGQYDMYRPDFNTGDERGYLIDQLGPDHPLNNQWLALRQIAYESMPALTYWAGGVPLKEKTFLGRDLRRPPMTAFWEMALGRTGLRDVDGEYEVENTLESMERLIPLPPVVRGELEGVPIGVSLQKEFNQAGYTVVSEEGFGDDDVSAGQSLTVKQKYNDAGEIVEGALLLTETLNEVTRGNNMREAFNALFNHPTYIGLESNPATSQDPGIVALPRSERRKRPATRMVDQIRDYYTALATEQIKLSNSEEAKQWRADVLTLQTNGAMQVEEYEQIQDAIDGITSFTGLQPAAR